MKKTGEWKALCPERLKKEKKLESKYYSYKYIIEWKWAGCQPNKKEMYSEEKAYRLYDCIDINGWGFLTHLFFID